MQYLCTVPIERDSLHKDQNIEQQYSHKVGYLKFDGSGRGGDPDGRKPGAAHAGGFDARGPRAAP